MSDAKSDAGAGMPRKRRRVIRPAVSGSDPHPAKSARSVNERDIETATEDNPAVWGDSLEREGSSNDARLLADRPPHWAQRSED